MQQTKKNRTASTTASVIARNHVLLHDEANTPAESDQQSALKLISTDITDSCQVTPPSRNGSVNTGRVATPSVIANNACASPLASTMSRAVKGVRNNRPNVPSRRSRLMQSAAINGTRIQMEQNSVPCMVENKAPPWPML